MSGGNESFLISLVSRRTIIWWIIVIVISILLLRDKDKKTKMDQKIRIMNYATIIIAVSMILYEVFSR